LGPVAWLVAEAIVYAVRLLAKIAGRSFATDSIVETRTHRRTHAARRVIEEAARR
jgi:hypothetical protein